MTEFAPRIIVRRKAESNLATLSRAPTGDSLHPLLQRIFANRNVQDLTGLDHSLSRLHPPGSFEDIDKSCEILRQAIDQDQSILIVGDYDTDGATATTVAILGLRLLGAKDVNYLVPNRFDYGYGLSAGIARVAVEMEPDLVITVDNGISSIEGVQLLRDAGVDVIVTDHHLAGTVLPDANAIINPNQPGCKFPSKMLSGVGVMFYLLMALRATMRDQGWFEQPHAEIPNLAQLLDLVALGTVADLVPLDQNNRILVAQGIARIRNNKCRPGIRALLNVAGKNHDNATSTDLGFIVGPRLNAAGRLDDISMGIECLLAEDEKTARELASILHEINTQRRQIEQKMQQQAVEIVSQISSRKDKNLGICLHNEEWHQGITGLVASRLKDRFHQPTIVFAGNTDGKLSGSGRSVPGMHIRDVLESISTRNPGLIEKFGGHAMAAGLTICVGDFDLFCAQFQAEVTAHFSDHPPLNVIYSDGFLDPEFFTLEIAELLRTAAPWGQQFPVPVFDNEFKVLNLKIVGEQHLKLRLASNGRLLDAIAFRQLEPGQPAPQLGRIKAAFQLDINEFRGTRSLQLIIDHIESVNEPGESTEAIEDKAISGH